MAIPSTQIDTWSKQGPIASSSTTYQSLKNALTDRRSPVAEMIARGTVKIDLQGSYAHDTNIYGDSDVDVIVRHVDTFRSNKHTLPSVQFQIHEQVYPVASYEWEDLRRDVITALSNYYGGAYVDTSGKKSLKVLPNSGRLRLDVVPAISHREYSYFYGTSNHSREDGIAFKNTTTGDLIINYPNHHYDNAVAKQAATKDRYKGLVRIVKNMRSSLVEKGRLAKEEAPSYFLQGMIYNVPNEVFVADRQATTLEALRWLVNADFATLVSQNEQHLLLGNAPEYWNPADAQKTLSELCFLWDNWGRI